METIHNVKHCPWITDEPIKLRDYFEEYHVMLDTGSFNNRPYHDKVRGYLNFWYFPSLKDRNHPGDPTMTCLVCTRSKYCKSICNLVSDFEEETGIESLKLCVVNLLTVEDEYPAQEYGTIGPLRQAGRLASWYAGSFQDGVIPDGGEELLVTLRHQSAELKKRETIPAYGRLRNRLFKYSSTVRMVISDDNSPMPLQHNPDSMQQSLRDIVLNVRVQRPYHRKVHMKKACNKFPSHSQELLVLGSQRLSTLRDALVCVNDLAVNKDFSADPRLEYLSCLPNSSVEMPSGFFYINGVFYDDMRHVDSKSYSEHIVRWVRTRKEIGPMKRADMTRTCFSDLELRLGYPYIFMHQGNCEHIIIFTDVRLHHQYDAQDPAKFPMLRGQASKLSVKCFICSLRLANLLVSQEQRTVDPHYPIYTGTVDGPTTLYCPGNYYPQLKNYNFLYNFGPKEKKKFEENKKNRQNSKVT
ncbi:unnamed protein product, partial [Meganyctiphanes norvegica]